MAGLAQQDLNELRSVADLRAFQDEIKKRRTELDTEYAGLPFSDEARDEFKALSDLDDEIEKRVTELEARSRILERQAQSNGNLEPTDRPIRTAAGPPSRLPENLHDLAEYRTRTNNQDELVALQRDGARKQVEAMALPSGIKRDETIEHVDSLLARDATGDLARRILVTSSPAYQRAFHKWLFGRGMTSAEQQAWAAAQEMRQMTVGTDADGGFAVPFTLDTTLIQTADVPVSALRRISRVIEITTSAWHGVSADGVEVTYEAELTQVTESQPTLDQPIIIPEKAQGYVEFSIELEQDWGNLQAELRNAFASAKNAKEAEMFMTGAGHGSNEPEGLLVGATETVETGGSSTFDAADLFALIGELPERYQENATILFNRFIAGLTRQFDEAGGGQFWANLAQGTPSRLIDYPVAYSSVGFDTSLAAGNVYAVLGDFSRFVIVDRVGLNVELIPHVLGAQRRPIGARALYAYFRNSSGVVDPQAFRVLVGKT